MLDLTVVAKPHYCKCVLIPLKGKLGHLRGTVELKHHHFKVKKQVKTQKLQKIRQIYDPWRSLLPNDGYLGDEQLTGCQLLLIGLDLAVGVGLSALQLLATVHQRLDLRLHLADVEASHGELLLHSRAVPLRL